MVHTDKRKQPGIIPTGFNLSKWPWWAIVLAFVGLLLLLTIVLD